MNKLLKFLIFLIIIQFNGYGQIKIEEPLVNAIQTALVRDISLINMALDIEKLEINRQELLDKYIPKLEANSALALYDSAFTLDVPTATLPITGIQLFEGKTQLESSGNLFRGELKLSSVLLSGNQIQNGAKALEKKAEANTYLLETEKDKIAKEVIKSFDQLFLIKASKLLLDDTQIRLKKETERIEKAIENGVAVPYDRDKIKLAQLEWESKRVALSNSNALLIRKITYLTGYDKAEIETTVYDLTPYMIFDKEVNIDAKQELKALASFKEALEYLLKKEKGSNLPQLGAFAALTYTEFFGSSVSLPTSSFSNTLSTDVNQFSIGPNWILGLGLKWELFSGFERKNKIKHAQISIDQMQNKIDDSKEKLLLLLDNNISNFEVALLQIDIAQQRKTIANNNLELATKQYREGIISITDRIAAENDLYKASLEAVETIINQRQAAIDVLIASGTLVDEIVKN